MTFLASEFLALKSCLTRLKTGFRFGRALLFHRNGVNLCLLLTEILHQRNVAWADPGTGTALDTVGKIVRLRLIVQLTFAVPVKLLRQQIRRAGIGTGAAANTAFLFLLFAHLCWGRGEQAVGNFHHRNIQPRQGKAHQRAAHNHHLVAARAESGLFQQMAYRCAQTRPDVARTRH